MDGLIHIGFYVGNAMAGPVKKNLGLKYNFALGALMTIIAAAYTIIFVEETLVKEEDREKEWVLTWRRFHDREIAPQPHKIYVEDFDGSNVQQQYRGRT